MFRSSAALLLSLVIVSSSCAYRRVQIRSVPDADSPLAERQEAYRDLAPTSALETTVIQNNQVSHQTTEFIILGDGTRVADPRDLLPAVLPTSRLAEQITKFDSEYVSYLNRVRTGITIELLSGVAAVIGLAVMLGANNRPYEADIFTWRRDDSAYYGGLATLLIGSAAMIGSAIAALIPSEAGDMRLSIFSGFERALKSRLGLDDSPPSPSIQKDAQASRSMNP